MLIMLHSYFVFRINDHFTSSCYNFQKEPGVKTPPNRSKTVLQTFGHVPVNNSYKCRRPLQPLSARSASPTGPRAAAWAIALSQFVAPQTVGSRRPASSLWDQQRVNRRRRDGEVRGSAVGAINYRSANILRLWQKLFSRVTFFSHKSQ